MDISTLLDSIFFWFGESFAGNGADYATSVRSWKYDGRHLPLFPLAMASGSQRMVFWRPR